MSKLTRRQKNDQKKNAKQIAVGMAGPKTGHVNPLCAVPDSGHVSAWPRDFSEMADRILIEVGFARTGDLKDEVPNRDRDLLAKGCPRGVFTRRDGTSVRPQYRDLASAS